LLPVSDGFLTAVATTHNPNCKVEVIQNGVVVTTLTPFDGSVTADRTAAQLRSCTISIADPTGTLTPVDASSLLAPFGTLIAPYRGVRVPSVEIISNVDNNAATFALGDNNGTWPDPTTGNLILGYGVTPN
jgi:hypothetical protein